jgi:hypothetical protein
LPALLAWAVAWGLFMGLRSAGTPVLLAMVGGTLLGVVGSVWGGSWWRRAVVALGFPLSLALSGVLAVPAWAWLLPLGLLLLVYPINAWRDAPLFPTPEGALDDLPDLAPLPPGARVLDAGCGLGQGLQALRAAEVREKIDIVNLEEAAEEYFEDGQVLLAESTGDEILATTDMPENLSDWEQAICNVSDGKALSGGQKGPSMITVIVAVVGVIVVIGAYMKK